MDKAEQKRIKREMREKEKQAFIDSLPMSKELFDELFDRLDEKLDKQGCDGTLNITLEFLENKGIRASKVVEWMKKYGGYCDCEVLANVEDPFNRFGLF
ncbi:MAG: DUF2695 domain-containing protein [Christensenellaceae bacterium]|jgi:hypothetical protein